MQGRGRAPVLVRAGGGSCPLPRPAQHDRDHLVVVDKAGRQKPAGGRDPPPGWPPRPGPAAAASALERLGLVRPERPGQRAQPRAARGASPKAWRCWSFRRPASDSGRASSTSAGMAEGAGCASVLNRSRKFWTFESFCLVCWEGPPGIGRPGSCSKALDLRLRVGGALGQRDDVRADEEQEFRPLQVVGVAAQDLADDRDLVEETELVLGWLFWVRCSPPRTIIWPSWQLTKEVASRWPMIGWLFPSTVTLPMMSSTFWSIVIWTLPSSPISGVTFRSIAIVW